MADRHHLVPLGLQLIQVGQQPLVFVFDVTQPETFGGLEGLLELYWMVY